MRGKRNFHGARTAGRGLWARLEAGHGLGRARQIPLHFCHRHRGTEDPRGSGGAAEGPDRSGGARKRGEGTAQRGSRAQPVRRLSPLRGSARAAASAVQSQAASRNRAAASPPLSESEPVSLSGPERPLGAAILQARDTLGAVGRPHSMPGAVVRPHSTPGAVVRHGSHNRISQIHPCCNQLLENTVRVLGALVTFYSVTTLT